MISEILTFTWSECVDAILSDGESMHGFGINNWALDRQQALKAITCLESIGVPIIGGDVYVVKDGNFQETLDNWYVTEVSGESKADICTRCARESEKYINNYKIGDVRFALVPKIIET